MITWIMSNNIYIGIPVVSTLSSLTPQHTQAWWACLGCTLHSRGFSCPRVYLRGGGVCCRRRPFLNSAYPVTAMEAIHELTVCPVTAKEAVQELSACPVMAKETIHELTVCTVAAMETAQELSACPVTAMETVHELTVCTVAAMETAQELSACHSQVVCPCLCSTMDSCSAMAPCSSGSDLVVSWSTALRSAIAPWPRSSTVPQSATDPWPRTSIDPQSASDPWLRTSSAPWSRPTSAPWFRPALAPGSRSTTGVHAMTHGLAQCPTLHAMIQVLFLFTGLVLRPSPCFTSAPPLG